MNSSNVWPSCSSSFGCEMQRPLRRAALAVDVRHVRDAVGTAHRARVGRLVPDVAGRSHQLGVGIAHVEAIHAPALQVAKYGPSGQRVVGVLAHARQCTGVARAMSPRSARSVSGLRHTNHWAWFVRARVMRYTPSIYRIDISITTNPLRSTRPEPPLLELAILGTLQEQPLHGYELKKRVGETLGSAWAISFGSLYPALRRLERDGAIEVVDPTTVSTPAIPATGSLAGDLAAARMRRSGKPNRRTRKAYRITEHGAARLLEMLLDPDSADDERTFALKVAFCGSLDRSGRLQLLERRRANLADDLTRARQVEPRRSDRYARSLVEHRTESVERDLQWVDSLIAVERGEHDSAEVIQITSTKNEGAAAS